MSFDLFLYCGGYWSSENIYLGGESHNAGNVLADTFTVKTVVTLVVQLLGYEDSMRKVSWFPPESLEEKEDLYNDEVLQRAVEFAVQKDAQYSKCDAVENNLGESFNAAIQIARTKPIVEMLGEIREKVMVSNEKKRAEAFKLKGLYTPRSKALLEQQIDQAKNCRSLSCGLGKYEVGYFNYKTNTQIESFIVQMRGDISCSCRSYLISGIPCCHIVSALRLEKNADQDPKNLLSDWFTVEKLRICCYELLQPANGMNLWPITTDVRVQPPLYKKPPGRPQGTKRQQEKGEPRPKNVSKRGTKVHCSTCGEEGHNKRYCKNVPKPKPLRRAPTRPRKQAAIPASTPFMLGSTTKASQDHTSLSSALPRRQRGRPQNIHSEAASSSQPAPRKQSM